MATAWVHTAPQNAHMDALKKYLFPILLFLGLVAVFAQNFMRPRRTVEPVSEVGATTDRSLEIVTLLPKDAIPSIDNPTFLTAPVADSEYAPDELVMGVDINGERRAYSTSLLSSHEIVNDVVGGRPIAVTW